MLILMILFVFVACDEDPDEDNNIINNANNVVNNTNNVTNNVNNTTTEPECGNGIVEAEETCDGTDLMGVTCQTLGYTAGTLACSAECRLIAVGENCQCETCDDTEEGECVDYQTDPNNCGECGNVCDEDKSCHDSICSFWEVCDGEFYEAESVMIDSEVDCFDLIQERGSIQCHRTCVDGEIVTTQEAYDGK